MIAILSCILPAILLGTAFASSMLQADSNTQALVNFHSISIRYVSGTNQIFNGELPRLQALNPAQLLRLDPSQLTSSDVSSLTHTPNSLLLFDGDWLNTHAGDAQTSVLLRTALSGVKLVAVGGTTSTLFDLLNTNGVLHLSTNPDGTLRNPDNFNAPQAGFALKTTTASDGTIRSFPSILTSNSENPDVLANAIADWLAN